VGSAARWHFRLAVGGFALAAAVELGAQAVRGGEGAGPIGWLLLLSGAAWVLGLVWRERVGIGRAWSCFGWVFVGGQLAMMLTLRSGFLFGRLGFSGRQIPEFGGVPVTVPLLWWLVIGGGYPVVEGLWGELRAGVSAFTALMATQLALMLLPFLGPVRHYWRWPHGGPFFGAPWQALAAWLTLALVLALGLVILGDNWSSAEARTRRQAWAPAAVLLTVTIVCLGANLLAGLWLAAAFSAANGALFGIVVVWHLRDHGAGHSKARVR
jgi:uncharacterized membrane protein